MAHKAQPIACNLWRTGDGQPLKTFSQSSTGDRFLEIEQPYFVTGRQATTKLYLNTGSSWTIGRSAENVFVFEDNAMSRRHAVVQQMQPGKFYFIDLGSSNGSTLNGRRITTPVELHDGDSLLCGETTLLFCKPTQESAPRLVSKAGGTVVLRHKRLVTVLVVDIRDFTGLARQIDEALLAQTVGTWFRELGSMYQRSGCATEKYIGDASMAVWVHESQIPNQKQICRVLETLLEIQQFTAGLHECFSLPSPVRIGAGINTGLSIMGNMGPQENPDFSPLGDSVNAAFRLESATKNCGFDVALGRLTFECLSGPPDAVNYFEKRMVEFKGYDGLVEAWLTSYSRLGEFLGAIVAPTSAKSRP
jgi:adenylate cyclase